MPTYLIDICRSFFESRTVNITYGSGSAQRWLNGGCPQGSITGPLMWIILFDSLLKRLDSLPNVSTFAYADDLLLVVESGPISRTHDASVDFLENASAAALDVVTAWGQSKNLIFNPDKTQCLFWRRSNRDHISPPTITMDHRKLTISEEMLYLGVVLHSSGSWIHHFEHAKRKAFARLEVCRLTAGRTWGICPQMRENLYKTIFLPVLLYAAPVWIPSFTKTAIGRKSLLTTQRQALIWCTSAFRTTSNDALHLLADVLPIDIEADYRCDVYRRQKGIISPDINLFTDALLK